MNTVSQDFFLNYGESSINISVPEKNLMAVLTPQQIPVIADLEGKLRESLKKPIGCPPLAEMAAGSRRVVIALPDQTRVLPSATLLPIVVDELKAVGVNRDQITVVIGVGNHRAPTEAEKRKILGGLYGQIRCYDSTEKGYKMLGLTSRGTPVEVSMPVADGDFVMALGNVELHQLACFSGGVKGVAVGTASKRALQHNHKLGRLNQGAENYVRLDMEEFARLAGLTFIVNTVMNQKREIVHLSAGDPVKAHADCARVAEQIFTVPVSREADIVVASIGGEPRDATLYQAQKGLQNALRAVKQDGIIIMAAKCREGFGDPDFKQWVMEAENLDSLIEKNRHQFLLGAHKTAYIAKAVQKANIYFVSDMPEKDIRKLYFSPFGNGQKALAAALLEIGTQAEILVMPWAGLTHPQIID